MVQQQQYIHPQLDVEAFNCPHCSVFARQSWYFLQASSQANGYGTQHNRVDFKVSHCSHCSASTIWNHEQMIFPDHGYAEPPNVDLPADIQQDYREAGSIVSKSPRGAAALLRLAIQKLCKHLGQPGKDINADIKALVAQGLPAKVQEALDSVRVIGNNAVHPGELDLRDDRETGMKLFRLINFVAAKMISEPKEIADIYGSLPEAKRKAIDHRDGRTTQ
jgi:hypothetical protein